LFIVHIPNSQVLHWNHLYIVLQQQRVRTIWVHRYWWLFILSQQWSSTTL